MPISLTKPQQNVLLNLAWQSIAQGLKTGKALSVNNADYSPALVEPCATFVILQYHHHPRGSFGNVNAVRNLAEDVSENAFAAAFCDKHFHSVTDAELDDLEIQIELLSPLEPLSFSSELDLFTQLRPHIDGLMLQDASHHAVFLPSYWETARTPMQFLQQLKQKAGLPATYWSKTIKASRFTTHRINSTLNAISS